MHKSVSRSLFTMTFITAAFLLSPSYADTTTQHLSVKDFFASPQVMQVKISPDGKLIAMVIADPTTGEARRELVIMNAASKKITPVFRTITDQVISRYWWANNSRLLVNTADQTGSLDVPVNRGDLYAINVDGSQIRQLMGSRFAGAYGSNALNVHFVPLVFVKMLHIPLGDAHQVVVESYDDVSTMTWGQGRTAAYSIDIYSGKFWKIASAPREGFDLMTDNAGNIRLAYGDDPTSGEATFYYRQAAHDLDWKNMRTLFQKSDPAFSEIGPLAFAPDDTDIYWLGRTDSATLGIFMLDPQTLQTRLLFGDPDNDVDQIIWSLDRQPTQKAVAVLTQPGGPNLHVLDGHALVVNYMVQLIHAFPGQMVDITSNSSDGKLLTVFVYSDRNPGSYYLFNTQTKHVDFLFNRLSGIDPKDMAVMQPITFKARDGVQLHGYLTLPAGSGGKGLPLIVNPHGGPHGIRDVWGWDPEVQFFANHGYAVLQVNYRGSGGYGMKFQDLGYRHWGTTMQSDLADAVKWAEQQGYADPKRVCIYGASYGGYAAVENSILYPDLYRCAVGYAGVYDLTLQAHHGDTHHYASGRNYLSVVLGDDEAELKAESPAFNVDKMKVPLFIVYGGKDMRVVPQNAEELMSAMDKAQIHYEKMYEPNEMHGFVNPEHEYELYTRMLAFFDKYIGSDAVKH